jgi:hypothetical protein
MNRIEDLIDFIKDKHQEIRRDIEELKGSEECHYILNKYQALLDYVESELKKPMAPNGGSRKTTRKTRRKIRK